MFNAKKGADGFQDRKRQQTATQNKEKHNSSIDEQSSSQGECHGPLRQWQNVSRTERDGTHQLRDEGRKSGMKHEIEECVTEVEKGKENLRHEGLTFTVLKENERSNKYKGGSSEEGGGHESQSM